LLAGTTDVFMSVAETHSYSSWLTTLLISVTAPGEKYSPLPRKETKLRFSEKLVLLYQAIDMLTDEPQPHRDSTTGLIKIMFCHNIQRDSGAHSLCTNDFSRSWNGRSMRLTSHYIYILQTHMSEYIYIYIYIYIPSVKITPENLGMAGGSKSEILRQGT
jgi:hypothetical protein